MGNPKGLWPKPNLNLEEEVRFYKTKFDEMEDELADVDFAADELITSREQVAALKDRLAEVEGVLVIHLNIGISSILQEILSAGRPTMIFAVPYSGHEWVNFGALQKQELGARMDCMLTTDYGQLAVAIRPFRAIHHLREAKILNVTTRMPGEYCDAIRERFGTEIKQVELERVVAAYNAVDDGEARAEAQRWIQGAKQVVEPSEEDVFKSCKMALAFERLLDEEQATVMTVACYGSMHQPLCQAYAYPCVGFVRLNNMGLGGICESDLQSAMTHVLFQGLVGKPGFISDPTMDEATGSIILAHCLGTPKMDGPDGPAAPYKLRTVMERQEGVVPQVFMRTGERVTQALLSGTERLLYFTGEITDAPDVDRGCRTKITVKIDGDPEKLWKNWTAGLHRQTCYGDVTKELELFCRFKEIEMVNEAV
jgi:L-fucose isomerase-like protein